MPKIVELFGAASVGMVFMDYKVADASTAPLPPVTEHNARAQPSIPISTFWCLSQFSETTIARFRDA